MGTSSIVQSTLLSKLNEQQALRAIQARGPMSRAEVARFSGFSAPTASKAVESLLRAGLLEELDAPFISRGRPAKRLQLASLSAQVLGLVIDAMECRIAAAGLDGVLDESLTHKFRTPHDYDELIAQSVDGVQRLIGQAGKATLGMGISIPGLIDYQRQRGIFSPNVPQTNGHSPGHDLAGELGIDCVVQQETVALCLAERQFGNARGINDFAMLDVSTGVGLGVISGGRILNGRSGLAGEIGHITVQAEGRTCGCGNRGCLETVASDSAFARVLSQKIDREVTIDEAIDLLQSGEIDLTIELERMIQYLGIGLAAVINLFNPSTVFVHSLLLSADKSLFPRLVDEAERRTLAPSFKDCNIVLARGSKRQGAIAAIIDHLTSAIVPVMNGDGSPARIAAAYRT